MAALNLGIAGREPKIRLSRGGGGPISRFPRGWGDGDGGGDEAPDFGEQLQRYRLGMAVALAAVFMLFISFTSAYMLRQGLGSWDRQNRIYVNDWKPVSLPLGLFCINTVLLLASSFSMEMSRRQAFQQAAVAPAAAIPGVAADEGWQVPWLQLTLLLGSGFIAGQILAWRELIHRGFYLAGNPGSSFVYLLTGLHAVHLAGGIVALLYAAIVIGFRSRPLERRRIVTDVTAWYWHFLTLLWMYIFALLRFVA